ncbi:MAG: hypothetical protein RQ982_08355 [Gammaproteobacteria bacterium]|nr:hypothetical protein [Gammaproteobacteria bacterium]
MKNSIYVILLAIFLTAGCSVKQTDTADPVTRMIVSQRGQDSILVIDLDVIPQIRSIKIPLTTALVTWTNLNVDIHPWGNVAYVTQLQTKTYIMNLTSGTELAAGTITDKDILKPLKSGTYLVAARNGYSRISSYSTLAPNPACSLVLTDRRINDLAVCDDNTTILVANESTQSSTDNPNYYVTELNIDRSGYITNPGHEIKQTEAVHQVSCAAGSKAGVAMAINPEKLISFTIDQTTGLSRVEAEDATTNASADVNAYIPQAIVFSPDGTELFARLSSGGKQPPRGWIEKFTFDPATGAITPVVGWVAEAPHTLAEFENARLTMSLDGTVIYVPDTDNSKIDVIKTSDGSQATAITDQLITSPTQISLGRVASYDQYWQGYIF